MPAGIPGSRPSASGRSPRPASSPRPCTAPPGIRAATAPFSAAGIRCIVFFHIRGSFSVPHHHGRLVPVVRVQHFTQPRLPAFLCVLHDRFHTRCLAHIVLLPPALFRAQAAVPFRRPARSCGIRKRGDVPGALHPEEGRFLLRVSPLRSRPASLSAALPCACAHCAHHPCSKTAFSSARA